MELDDTMSQLADAIRKDKSLNGKLGLKDMIEAELSVPGEEVTLVPTTNYTTNIFYFDHAIEPHTKGKIILTLQFGNIISSGYIYIYLAASAGSTGFITNVHASSNQANQKVTYEIALDGTRASKLISIMISVVNDIQIQQVSAVLHKGVTAPQVTISSIKDGFTQLANAIRQRHGVNKPMTLAEMISLFKVGDS